MLTAKFAATCPDFAWAHAPAKPYFPSCSKSGPPDKLGRVINEYLYPMFQPVVDARSGRVEYYELLTRIRGDASLTRHRKLIEVCERVGLIHRIDFFMLGHALDLLTVRPDLSVACNISLFTVEMEGDGYLERLARHAAVADRLVIEITESRSMQSLSTVTRFAERVRALGCRIALDDVGAGFFTLQDIADIRADFVKLDGGLVARAHSGESRQVRTSRCPHDIDSIIVAAAASRSRLIAEGIESAALLRFASDRGIPLVQGYFYGRPAPTPGTGLVDLRAA